MNEEFTIDYCISINFQRLSENPSRVFRATSDLIDTFQDLDINLARSIDTNIKPTILLQNIESGSIKTWLRTILSSVDNEALKSLDWKKFVGGYLVKGKEKIVEFLMDKEKITERKQISDLQHEILQIAEQTQVRQLPAYAPVPTYKLLKSIDNIATSLAHLHSYDKAVYITSNGEFPFNLNFKIASEAVEDFATREIIENDTRMILKIKKPDFLGESMWEFKHEKRTIIAKLLDFEWLNNFHNRKLNILPGDSIRAMVHTEVKYGYDNDVVATHYSVTQVNEHLKVNTGNQQDFFD